MQSGVAHSRSTERTVRQSLFVKGLPKARLILLGLTALCCAAGAEAGEREELYAAFQQAGKLEEQGDYASAAAKYERAVALAPRVFGPDASDTGIVLSRLASAYRQMGDSPKAEQLYLRSLRILEAALGPDHTTVAQVLNNLALACFDQGEYAKAASIYERAIRVFETNLGVDDPEVGKALNNLAQAYRSLGQHQKAEQLYLRSLKILETRLGPDHPSVSHELINLAIIYAEQGEFAKAESLHLRALKIREGAYGPDHPEVAESLDHLASLYARFSQFTKAEPLYLRALRIREARLGAEHPGVATTLNHLASLYDEMGQFATAEPLFLRSIKIRETRLGADHPELAESLNNLAAMYIHAGEYTKAERLFRRAIEIDESRLGADHPDVAIGLNNLAIVYELLGQYAKAEQLYLRSIAIKEPKLGPDHLSVAASLMNLAKVYEKTGQFAKSEECAQRSLKLNEAKLGPDDLDIAKTIETFANLYVRMGQHAKAEPLYQRSLKIKETILPPDHPDLASILDSLANLYCETDQPAKAEPLYQRSLAIREAKLGPDHPNLASSLNNLAILHAATGRTDLAAAELDRERRSVRRYVARVLPSLGEQDQLKFLEHDDQVRWHVALTLACAKPGEPSVAARSAAWALNGKAVAHETLVQQKLLARDNKDPAVAAKIAELRAVQSELAGLSQLTPSRGDEAAHRRRVAELSTRQDKLAREAVAGQSALEQAWVEIDAIRGALPDSALLVDIVRFFPTIYTATGNKPHWEPARYVAWLTSPAGKGEVTILDLGDAKAIEAAVERVRSGIAEAIGEENKPGLIAERGDAEATAALDKPLRDLADLTLRPIVRQAGDAKQLILSPDAALWLAPWAALPLADGRCAVEAFDIRYVVSGRDLVAEHATAGPKTSPPIMMADPNFDLNPKEAQAAARAVFRGVAPPAAGLSLRSTSQSGSLVGRAQRLPGTAEEARAIRPKLAAYAGATPTLYEDRYALEAVFAALQRPKALVMSTHGFFLPDQETKANDSRAGEVATGGGMRGAALATDGTPLENPLLRCGLLLAGCNRRDNATGGDDGILTGMEIVGTDLRGTDLVVLSACETGLGQVRNGEGVAGLRQAFQLAGARAVVATLWQIPDKQSAQLMTDFFTNLAAGQSKAEALRRAQLQMIEARRTKYGAAHPFFWAAYTLTGN